MLARKASQRERAEELLAKKRADEELARQARDDARAEEARVKEELDNVDGLRESIQWVVAETLATPSTISPTVEVHVAEICRTSLPHKRPEAPVEEELEDRNEEEPMARQEGR